MAEGLPSLGAINKLTFKLGPTQLTEDEQKKGCDNNRRSQRLDGF